MSVASASPVTAATLDMILAADGPPTENSGTDENERAQRLVTIHVTAPAPPHTVVQAEVPAPKRKAAASTPLYRFGESEPILVCTVLRACIIELETTETLVDDPIAVPVNEVLPAVRIMGTHQDNGAIAMIAGRLGRACSAPFGCGTSAPAGS